MGAAAAALRRPRPRRTSLGALGALIGGLTREARTASLVALLVVLPIVFLGLVPKEVVPAAAWISEAFPFSHAAKFFQAALFDADPWTRVGREALWLVGLGAGYGLLARTAARSCCVRVVGV